MIGGGKRTSSFTLEVILSLLTREKRVRWFFQARGGGPRREEKTKRCLGSGGTPPFPVDGPAFLRGAVSKKKCYLYKGARGRADTRRSRATES